MLIKLNIYGDISMIYKTTVQPIPLYQVINRLKVHSLNSDIPLNDDEIESSATNEGVHERITKMCLDICHLNNININHIFLKEVRHFLIPPMAK